VVSKPLAKTVKRTEKLKRKKPVKESIAGNKGQKKDSLPRRRAGKRDEPQMITYKSTGMTQDPG